MFRNLYAEPNLYKRHDTIQTDYKNLRDSGSLEDLKSILKTSGSKERFSQSRGINRDSVVRFENE